MNGVMGFGAWCLIRCLCKLLDRENLKGCSFRCVIWARLVCG